MKTYKKALIIIILFILIGILIFILHSFNFFQQTIKYADDFEFEDLISSNDYDQDGIDDYTDILQNAQNYIATNPTYKSKYYDGGYPDDDYGVCTDVIWNALLNAGYDLKTAIDLDIQNNPSVYPAITSPDPNIDFRRVRNLNIFFSRYTTTLTVDTTQIEEFMPGDIIVFDGHIGILSNKRNQDGLPFLIHHDTYGAREKNDMSTYDIVAHYRIDSPFIIE